MGPAAPDFNNFTNQVHDFDPGIAANGLFWTLVVNNANVLDYHDIPNALVRGPSHPATVSFVVNWHRGSQRTKVRDTVNGFAAELVQNTATMSWSAITQGISYVSGPESTSSGVFASVGHERNGAFFPRADG